MARARTKPAEDPPEGGNDLDEPEVPDEDEVPPTVVVALSRVMGDVQSVSKNSRNQSQNFNFRGIDAVMNAVGPALRAHGVVVVPIHTQFETEHYETRGREGRSGTAMKNVMLTVRFRFYGPRGDHIDATATGEASDSGDKAMPKAHSVAFRTMLLQALCIPTDEPDPDLESHDRAAQPFRGSSGDEPRAQERNVEQPAYNFPADWGELTGRMFALLGDDEAKVWMAQAKTLVTGCSPDQSISTLPEADQMAVWDVLTKTLRSLDEELKVDPRAFPPSSRAEIAAEFAKHLDGQILAGPPWALSGEEAEDGYPSKESVLDGAPDVTSPETDAQAVLEQESREPTSEEIAEAEAALAEEAAAAAEADK